MPSIDIGADASKGLNELGRFGNALDSVTDRIKALNVTQAEFNRKGEFVRGLVKTQVGEFATLTQTISKTGKVVSSVYSNNEEAARRAAEVIAKAAKKKIEAEEKAAQAAIKAATKKAEADAKEQARLEAQGTMFSRLTERIGRNLIQFASYRAFNFVTDQIEDGIKAAKDFQIQLSLIRTISQDNQQSFRKFGQDVRGVSDRSGFDIKDVGKAFYDTTSNQVAKGADVAPFVKQAADLARVTGSELPDAVNILSSVINAYGLSASDAEKVSASLFKTFDEGRIVSSELANTFGRVLVLGKSLGVEYQDLEAILAITTQKGLKTSDAMTLLTNILIKLEKPTEATKNFFADLGVNSGEAAVAVAGGIIPLVNKMVAAVKAGRVDVSAFFDEIRGRKQFGVFEQSGEEIEKFANSLKNTGKAVNEYQEAIKIRGESPADQLNKELNKLSNVFKVDLGQAIVGAAADMIKFVGGVDNAGGNIQKFGELTRGAVPILGAYAAAMGIVTAANAAATIGFRALAVSAGVALAPLLAAAAAYVTTRQALRALNVGEGEKDVFGPVNVEAIQNTADVLENVRVRYEKLAAAQKGIKFDPLASFGASAKSVDKTYQDALSLVAGATRATDSFLNNTKARSKETADALKIGFGNYTDVFKNKINDIKKGITEANTEVERSKKSLLKFQESLDEILFSTKLKYANDDFGEQKIRLTEQRIIEVEKKRKALFAEGTEESIAEGRKLYDEQAKYEQQLFDLRTDHSKNLFESYLQNNPAQAAQPGGNIFSVDPLPLQERLAKLAAERAADEEKIQKSKAKYVQDSEKQLKSETENLRRLEQAIKRYEEVANPFEKGGTIKEEFRDKDGKFDLSKYRQQLGGVEDQLRSVPGATFEDRVALERLLVERRKAGIDEAEAYDRSESLKTLQTKLLADKDAQQKRIEDLKKQREKLLAQQNALETNLGNKGIELAGFGSTLAGNARTIIKEEDKAKIAQAIQDYQKQVQELFDKRIVKDGVAVADPVQIEAVRQQYRHALDVMRQVAAQYKVESGLYVEGPFGKIFDHQAQSALDEQIRQLQSASSGILGNLTSEKADNDVFKKLVTDPLEKLKGQFPELTRGADDFTAKANQGFTTLANGGVELLRQKLKEVQDLMRAPGALAPGAKVGAANIGADTGVAYAATGGIAGMFPGQPRGQDVYPIWAARGERIIDAQTSAMYAPMLDAIMSRRQPRYMAGGGIVGGDTYVGDVNVTVNESRQPRNTGRLVGKALERQLRLNNIRLERK